MDLLTDQNNRYSSVEELLQILEEKEIDIKMAAEYGMGLLENKQELEKQNDDLKDKIEANQHELQMLKSQLESLKREYEQNLCDSRLETLKVEKILEVERKNAKKSEKQLQEKIQELMTCNDSLTEQMLSASINEEETKHQINSLQLHVTEAELDQGNTIINLKNELSDLRVELENKVALKTNECRLLSTALDDALLEITQLKHEKEKDQAKIIHLKTCMHNLEDKYLMLLSKNETSESNQTPSSTSYNEDSLFAELDVLSNSLISGTIPQQPGNRYTIGSQLKQEIMEVYRQIQRLTMEVKGSGDLWSPEAVDINDLKAGQLLISLTELNTLVNKRLQSSASPLYDELTQLEMNLLTTKDQLNLVKDQLASSNKNLETVKQELNSRNQQLHRKQQECESLQKIITDLEKSRNESINERDRLFEIKNNIDSKDMMYQLIKEERDTAQKMNIELKVELLNLQINIKSLDQQLIESVEQKLLLSKQLEEWQNDMRDLIEDKMAGEIAKDKLQGKKLSVNDKIIHKNNNSLENKTIINNKKFSLRWS